jgi:hypothetical protein
MTNEQTSAAPGVEAQCLTLQAACVAREDVAQRRGYSDRSNAERSQAFLSDGNDGCGFDDRRLGLVGDQLAQERNQHDELS